jgi:hypothetical protein
LQTASPHNGQNARFWSVVKANITDEGRPVESAFSDWWSQEHVPQYTARPGFLFGRRLRAVTDPGQERIPDHKYLAVYEVVSVDAFNSALADGPPWGPWHADIDRYVCDWERTYYRLLSIHEVDSGSGRYWAIVKLDFVEPIPGRESEFNEWYTNKHVPELCANPGFHRAWRLAVEPDDNDLGPRRQRYWAVYEVDSPADFTSARARRVEKGIRPWDGIWTTELQDIQMDHYELIYSVDHSDALRATEQRRARG